MADWEHLPFDLVEELKAKNLYWFVIPEESTCNQIIIEVFKNEKYRQIAKEWGGIVGVHIIPGVDRKPFTNEKGDRYVSGTLEDIEPLNGFKWEDDWTVVKVDGVTDESGFQYATTWRRLRNNRRSTTASPGKMSWVRRQKLRRSMVVDLQSVGRLLPYELVAHMTISSNVPSSSLNTNISYYVEFISDGIVRETGALGPPLWAKDFILPLSHIARQKKVGISLLRSQSSHNAPIVSSFTVGDIVDQLNTVNSEQLQSSATPYFSTILLKEKQFSVFVEFRINEHTIFNVVNTEECFADGQLNQVVMMENKISHRLKEQIIMLSLSLESNCNGLLKDITSLRTEGQDYISDFDLINILQDINQIQSTIKSTNSDLNKVISYLRDAESAHQPIFYLHYPYYMPLFTKWIPFGHFFGEQDLSSLGDELMNRIADTYSRTQTWFRRQPVCTSTVMKCYHEEWHREARGLISYTYRVYLFVRKESSEIDEEGSSSTYGIFWNNIYDYYKLLRYLSAIKYDLNNYADEVIELEGMLLSMEGRSFEKGLLTLDFQEECIHISLEDITELPSEDVHLFPVRIPFELLEAVEISHAHSLTMSHLLEVKLLSVTSFQLANAPVYEHEACICIDTVDGQHYETNFSIRHDGINGGGIPEPATGEIKNTTVRILLPYWTSHSPEEHGFADSEDSIKFRRVPSYGSSASHLQAQSANRHFVFLSLSARPATAYKTNSVQLSGLGAKRDSGRFAPNSPASSTHSQSWREKDKDGQSNGLSISMGADVVRLGQAALPGIGNSSALSNEQELQIVLERPILELHVNSLELAWTEEKIKAYGWDIYLLFFLADREGHVLVWNEPVNSPVSNHSGSNHSSSRKSILSFGGSGKKKSQSSITASHSTTGVAVTGGSGGVFSSSKNASLRSGYIHRTAVISAEDGYNFGREGTIVIDAATYPVLETAHYLLIEVWGIDNEDGQDICLGEVLIPTCTASTESDLPIRSCEEDSDDEEGGSSHHHSDTPPATATNCYIIRSSNHSTIPANSRNTALAVTLAASSKHLFTLGTLRLMLNKTLQNNGESYSNPSTPGSARSQALRNKGNLVKLAMSSRPLQPGDCAWPAQILNANEKRLEMDIFYLSILQSGLQISFDKTANQGHSDRIVMLEECQERISNATSPCLKLLIPYTQLQSSALHILCEHTVLLQLTLHRAMSSSSNKGVVRQVEIQLLLGPCLAEDMYASICNHISVQEMRQALQAHLLSNGKEQEESFHKLAKALETSIYESMNFIEERNEEQRLLASETPPSSGENDGALANSPLSSAARVMREISKDMEDLHLRHSSHEIDPCCLDYVLTSLTSRNPTIKQLYLRLATFRIYLWYLLQQAPASYSAEKHYLDTNWILFDERSLSTSYSYHQPELVASGRQPPRIISYANQPINTTNYSTEIDALLYRIGDHMRRLEQEVRHIIYRALHHNYMDVSTELTRTIFTKYKEIVAMLLDTIDVGDGLSNATTTTGPLPPSDQRLTTSSGKHTDKQQNQQTINKNPQKKRDLIKFVITHDEIFESYCNYILRSHNYKFNKRPLLSLSINFQDLLDTFSSILDASLLMWNTRTLKHFMEYQLDGSKQPFSPSSSSSASTTVTTFSSEGLQLPWEITTIQDKQCGREMYISHIPETIQLQLNVEIGLKKITPLQSKDGNNDSNTISSNGVAGGIDLITMANNSRINRSMESFQRIEAMNGKIMNSLILSYIALAAEYENVLNRFIQNVATYLLPLVLKRQPTNSLYSSLATAGSGKPGQTSSGSNKLLRFGQNVGGGDNRRGSSTFTTLNQNEKTANDSLHDEVISFLFSVVNDCYRINTTHIPQTIDLFVADFQTIYQNTANSHNAALFRFGSSNNHYGGKGYIHKRNVAYLGRRSFTGSIGGGVTRRSSCSSAGGSSRLSDSGGNHPLRTNATTGNSNKGNLSFNLSRKVVNTVTYKALNELSNQLFFFTELRYYFLNGFDDYGHIFRYYHDITTGSVTLDNSQQHSPLELIKATFLDFLVFASHHIMMEELCALVYLCLLKIIIRYLLFLRDYHDYRARVVTGGMNSKSHRSSLSSSSTKEDRSSRRLSFSFGRKSTSSHANIKNVGSETVQAVHEHDLLMMEIWEKDMRQLKTLFTETRHRIFSSPSREEGDDNDDDDNNNNNNKSPSSSKRRSSKREGQLWSDSKNPSEKKSTRRQEGQEEDNGDDLSDISRRFERGCILLIKKLSFFIMSALTNDWVGTASLNRFLVGSFGIQPPERLLTLAVTDSDSYYNSLETFFSTDNAFTHFSPLLNNMDSEDCWNSDAVDPNCIPRESDSEAFGPRCSLRISGLACVQVVKYRSIFLKVIVNKEVYELPLQANSNTLMSWNDIVKWDNMQMNQLKELRIELYGFQIRPLKVFRQQLIGTVVINLGDIIRSSQTSEVVLSPSLSDPPTASFSEMSQKLSFKGHSFATHGGGDGIETDDPLLDCEAARTLCAHTAWYIVQPSNAYKSTAKKYERGENPGVDLQSLQQSPKRNALNTKGGVGYLDSLAAGAFGANRGPRPDCKLPQLRLTIQVLKG